MAETAEDLAAKRDSLYQRLEAGYAKIENGLARNKDMTRWESFWIQLLHEYEQVCQEIQAATREEC